MSGIKRVPGRGWHSLRRKFATELKDVPLRDLCHLGGWKDPQTVLKCYQKPDEATMRAALEVPPGQSASERAPAAQSGGASRASSTPRPVSRNA